MYRVLICDDQPDIVNALKIYLKPEGYQLFTARNGKEAVEVVQQQDIHLVLLDIMMPVMDGITAISKIREFSNVPIILLTAKSETEDLVLGLNVGGDDYIPSCPWRSWQESAPSCVATRCWAAVRRKIPISSPWAAFSWMTGPNPSPWKAKPSP